MTDIIDTIDNAWNIQSGKLCADHSEIAYRVTHASVTGRRTGGESSEQLSYYTSIVIRPNVRSSDCSVLFAMVSCVHHDTYQLRA